MHRDSTNENLQNIVYTVVENVLKDESLDYRLEENATNDPEDLSFVEEFSHFSIIDESRNHMKKYISHKDKQNMENPFILEDFRSGGKSKSSINTARKAKRRIPMEVNYLFPDLRSPEEEDL